MTAEPIVKRADTSPGHKETRLEGQMGTPFGADHAFPSFLARVHHRHESPQHRRGRLRSALCLTFWPARIRLCCMASSAVWGDRHPLPYGAGEPGSDRLVPASPGIAPKIHVPEGGRCTIRSVFPHHLFRRRALRAHCRRQHRSKPRAAADPRKSPAGRHGSGGLLRIRAAKVYARLGSVLRKPTRSSKMTLQLNAATSAK